MNKDTEWKKVRIVELPKFGKPGNRENDERYYSLDGKNVFCDDSVIKGADFESFVYCLGFAKDKNSCYRRSQKYKEADPKTFEVLNFHFAKDKNHIYSLDGIAKKVDHETFEVLDVGYEINNFGEKSATVSFSSDKTGIWWMDYYSLKPVLIKGTNKNTFQRIDDSFSKDDKYVYYIGARLPKGNPLTWKRLNQETYFSQDQNRIYFTQNLLEDADSETFEIISIPELGTKPYAKDKNAGYICHNAVSHKELKETIDEELKYITDLKKG
jgi:hypothetical protein